MKESCYAMHDQKMISHICGNGLKICIFPKPGFKRSFALLAVNYGSNDISFKYNGDDYTSPLGVAHFLEHKVFEQPDGGNALQIFAKTGASPNAFTSKNMTAYHFSCTEKFTKNLEILLSFVTSPYFTEENVKKEQGIIGQEISMVNDRPSWRAYELIMSGLYGTHPAKDSIIGTVESIGTITRDVLFKCYNTFYVPSNMTLCVAGDVSPEKVISTAEAMLTHEKKPCVERDYGKETDAAFRAYSEEYAETALPQFAIGAKHSIIDCGAEGMHNRVLADIAADVLAGPSSSLYAELYADGTISADFDSSASFFPGSVAMMISGESRTPERVLSELEKTVKKLSEDIDDGYFNRIKKAHIGMRLRSLDSVKSLCHEQAEAVFAGYDYLDTIKATEAIEKKDVCRFIREVFKKEAISLSVVKSRQV